ncbi:hypothetical protein LIN78_12115 [Leeia sp. TBRC 13508]|uniref:Uncharacterized protein n=1 Tax=Leeia speluncae TaxID=2884804 RepID=A0ABS8D7X2_9NEIS|nr:hypothetical protein [Leeia speluncae]MCB6184290.1 hypothetical protein [Leeia speluncae]
MSLVGAFQALSARIALEIKTVRLEMAGLSGGGSPPSLGSVDFGSGALDTVTTVINDSALSIGSSVLITAITQQGEEDMDCVIYSYTTFNGGMTVTATAVPGPVAGIHTFTYLVK